MFSINNNKNNKQLLIIGVCTKTFTKTILGNKRLINYDKKNKNNTHYFVGPASITYYFPFIPDKIWFMHDEIHRIDGPAIITDAENMYYYHNDEIETLNNLDNLHLGFMD